MIFDYPPEDAPIRQGDIFVGIPRIDISLQRMLVVDDHGEREVPWRDLLENNEAVHVIVPVRRVAAIVITQDCDAERSPDITLCEIREFRDVERKSKDTKSPKSWKNIITQHARINQKWFYLPPDVRIGFESKQAVDFLVTLRVPREDLKSLGNLRRGRLNDLAGKHFRERIAEFFRRYPYNEWYALDREELTEYRKEYPDTEPYSWQDWSGQEI
ncbi:MAG: hypothetical protein KJ052_04405 [Candidatus Hydrogenedentes bacterium]|nr:hypothetical protein [Candidatus Hydrogenedentota bacterium]